MTLPSPPWYQFPLREALRDHFTLEISITDVCDLSCNFCCHATRENPNKRHMPLDSIKQLAEVVTPHEFFAIKLSGGEPTLHPRFREIVMNLRKWFPAHFYTMASNGRLLLRHIDLLHQFDSIEVSHYPDLNDLVFREISESRVSQHTSLTLWERVDGEGMHDVFTESNLDGESVYQRCRYPAWKKVVQGRIYPCSNIFGLAIRQGFDAESVSVPIDGDWRHNLAQIDIEDHCKRCWVRVGQDAGSNCRML